MCCWHLAPHKTIASPSRAMGTGIGETNSIIRHSTNSESPTHLQKMLEICIGIFIRLAGEQIFLHHVDQRWLEFEVSVSHRRGWSGWDISVGGVENSRIVLSAIGADKVLSTGSTVFVSWFERNF
jgi:hypothetical protein